MPTSWLSTANSLTDSQRHYCNDDHDDAEKGLHNISQALTTRPPLAHFESERRFAVEKVDSSSPRPPEYKGESSPVLNPEPAKAKAVPSTSTNGLIRRSIPLRIWFDTYRKFFLLCTSLNLVAIILAGLGHFPYAVQHSGAMVLGNLVFAVLVRNELFLRVLYMAAIYGLRSWAPLKHISWLIFKITMMIRHRVMQDNAVIATGVITSILICISVLSALPWIRNNHHNTFEIYHRFIGWLGVAMTWVFVILGSMKTKKDGKWVSDARILLSGQEVWFAIAITILIALPWVTLRKVPVEVEFPSPKVAILRFNRGMQQGLTGRISRTAVKEFHAFGIISEGVGSPYHYMVCGVQGDFTRNLVSHPPKTVWTRELKFAGVGHASAMFKRGIRICTGTGIGAALSTCIQSPNWFFIWIGSDQDKTFGPTISGLIHNNIEPERMVLWDTKQRGGRPNTMELIKETWLAFQAEVVFITSNKQGNDEIMEGCFRGIFSLNSIFRAIANISAGIPAFGTLWDF
ncbi:hypothetical protein FSPOR_8053 [Fusarium sporotrichioides]|uniref:Non-ribosomal peptide synthetase n=1 Tax=Fusarium sporotrichioides TaxID=5514 RepID=A0A395RW48_FUSSP|nr:hypothetical protein FSPOR_8053 [Fusarium sporotrichioides]